MTDREQMQKLAPLGYYKWHWQRYRANRRVQRMDYIARGLYRELLDEQWSDGSLPNDLAELADICGCPVEVMREKWPQMEGCFEEGEDGRLFNHTMEDQRTEMDLARVAMSEGGSKGGKKSNSKTRAVDKAYEAYPDPTLGVPRAKDNAPSRVPDIEEKSREEKSREEKYVGSALKSATPIPLKIAGSFPLNDGSEYLVYQPDVDMWAELYPAIDVKQQLRNFKGWLIGNPKNRKTRNGMLRAIHNWLKVEQNRAPRADTPALANRPFEPGLPTEERAARAHEQSRELLIYLQKKRDQGEPLRPDEIEFIRLHGAEVSGAVN